MHHLITQEYESKTEQASAALLALAHERGPGIKLPTIEEMCTRFGVSRTALEPALQALERRGLVSRRRGSGIYVTERIRHKTIGVVFGGNIFSPEFSPYWSLLLQAVGAQAGACQIYPQAYLDIPQGELGGHLQLIEDLNARRLDGLLLYSFNSADHEARMFQAYGIPVVLTDSTAANWAVNLDHAAGLQLAAQAIVRQVGRRVAVLGPPASHPMLDAAIRQQGVTDVTIEDWSYETWARTIPGAGSREHCAYRLTQERVSQRAQHLLPEVLVSMDDTATRGVITALLQAGLAPGRDLTIITFQNAGSPVLDAYAADIRCLTYDPAAQAHAALAMLSTLMHGGTPPERHILIAPTVTAPNA
jgi:DNA-binding LacI/PurR family transcriptional regulator